MKKSKKQKKNCDFGTAVANVFDRIMEILGYDFEEDGFVE